jgi:hypothetical protein
MITGHRSTAGKDQLTRADFVEIELLSKAVMAGPLSRPPMNTECTMKYGHDWKVKLFEPEKLHWNDLFRAVVS